MTSYKYLIVLVPLLIFGYAGYYFNTSGGGQLLTTAFTQDIKGDDGVSIFQLFAGKYRCEADDGCAYPVTILLLDDTTFEITYTDAENDSIIPVAGGTWGVGQKNRLTLLVDRRVSAPSVPNSIHGVIDTMRIKEFSKKKSFIEGMNSPAFTRISN